MATKLRSPTVSLPQSSAYINQALDALTDAYSAAALYVPLPSYYAGASILGAAQEQATAQNRRLQFLRNTVLFSALAAEAYANEFISAVLSAADAEAVDRLKTPDKLLLAPRLAGQQTPLDRGREPLQGVVKLFVTRNALVHPRPGGISAFMPVGDEDQGRVGPEASAYALYAVARTIVLLEPLLDRPHAIGEATLIAEHRAVFRRHIASLGEDIAAIPSQDAPTPVHLLEQMRQRAARRAVRRRASEN